MAQKNDAIRMDRVAPAKCPLTQTLTDMDFSAVSDLFAQNETGAPAVLWNPNMFDVTHPVIKSFAELMLAGSDRPNVCELIQKKSFPFEPWLMVLEPNSNHSDFKYLKYGSEISSTFGRDMTGEFTSSIGNHTSRFFIALYSAVVARKQSVLSIHVPPPGVFATIWRRLIVPLLSDSGDVHNIAAVNVPDNELRAGLEALPDPTLVVREDGLLMYTNKAARQIFGDLPVPRSHVSAYCGIDIRLPKDAAAFCGPQSSEVARVVGSRNQVLVHFEVRTSATYFRGTPYFVVQMKPI